MKQYLDLLKKIKTEGVYKSSARENMPGTLSLFGYQMRFNLQEGFPAITTKQLYWKGVVIELLWFLRGDTNIKYLDENNVTKMWHQDAYNYYCKFASENGGNDQNCILTANEFGYSIMKFEEFCKSIKEIKKEDLPKYKNYTLGDCGKQYGWLWRSWGIDYKELGLETIRQSRLGISVENMDKLKFNLGVDQIKNVINSIKTNPESRRNIVTAWNPATIDEMALPACHSFLQFNCRKLTHYEKYMKLSELNVDVIQKDVNKFYKERNLPEYYIDSHIFLRSGDMFLGVPLDIASYALLTHIIAKICNMIPGELVSTIGDAHIYENHFEAVEKQLQNEPKKLPTLKFSDEFELMISNLQKVDNVNDFANYAVKAFQQYDYTMFTIENYEHCGKIEAELSTGMIKINKNMESGKIDKENFLVQLTKEQIFGDVQNLFANKFMSWFSNNINVTNFFPNCVYGLENGIYVIKELHVNFDTENLITLTQWYKYVFKCEKEEYDFVKPQHYKLWKDNNDVNDIIRASLTKEEYQGFIKGNILAITFR